MLNTITGGCSLPRQILRWLDSLDLSYTIRNPRIDLVNGFLVAEILSNTFQEQVNIYSYYNNQAKDKRINNWEQIQKVLLRKNFRLDKEEYEAMSNLSPNTALDMIYKLYEFLTRKKTKNDNRTIEISDEAPLYTKPTASYLAKDRQLGIIVDKNQKQIKTKKTIQKHLTTIKNKKYTTGLIEWLIAKRKAQINQQVRRQEQLLNKKTRTIGIQPRGQVKQIQLKCFNQSNQRNKSKNKSVIDFILDSFFIYMKKDFIIKDIHRLGYELKQKNNVNIIEEIFKRCGEQEEDRRKVSVATLEYLLKQFSEPAQISLVFENIHNNFSDFKDYFNLFIPVLKVYDENDEIYKLILQLIFKMSLKLVEYDSYTTEMMFVELALENFISVSKQNFAKTRSICEIILSFSKITTINQYEMITRVKEHLLQQTDFIHYLSYFISIILVNTQEIQENLWNQSYDCAIAGLSSASPVTRTSAVKIISQLVIFADQGFFENLNPLTQLVEDDWWEVRALALVIYSRLLISKKKSILEQNSQEQPNQIDYERAFKQILFSILKIFYVGTDDRILRVGLMELAQLLNYQPSLCTRYLEVLLHVNGLVLDDLLNIQQNKIGCLTDTKNTFEYRLTGAASQWNPLGLVSSLYENFQQTLSGSLSQKHLNIILSCVQRHTQTKNLQQWFSIYIKLLPHLIQSLKIKQTCIISSNVIELFFKIQTINQDILFASKQHLSKHLDQIYNIKTNDAITNTTLFLLKDISSQSNQYSQYIYQVIKQFSEQSRDKYLQSNLVGFMNDLAKRRRERIN